ncbi:GHMP kinase [Bradyrhizobium barranii subsp. apii]|uniref:GHMP kinase n=1 Tax=Bradyrhizobium barranii subsp. apii TaxID=2819348 RepID=A0A8T5VUP1_9BRAD|nr:dehydrogenase [Bradyrhizobium barranii]UPT88643.1 GHMP kinase [Bradyrhizobium barranii subsp. apii]
MNSATNDWETAGELVARVRRISPRPQIVARARAPLRLGLAGGGTDVSPYANIYGGAVMNVTIDRYIYASVSPAESHDVELESLDLGLAGRWPSEAPLSYDGKLDLHKATYNRVMRDFHGGQPLPLRISTYSEAPAGSGLGSSSTLVVAVLQALGEFLRLPLGEYDIAHLAYMIERKDLGLAGGRQDQFAAAFGGFNFMEFRDEDQVIVNPLRIKREVVTEFEAQTILCFTGVSRESATIIAEQTYNVQQGATKSVEAMHRLKETALEMKEALLRGDLSRVARALQVGWSSKQEMAAGINNRLIDDAFDLALDAGAIAGKVSGAGGGGFIVFLAPLERRRAVMSALATQGYAAETVRFTSEGAMAWRV